jgi:hypothetical protein
MTDEQRRRLPEYIMIFGMPFAATVWPRLMSWLIGAL